MKINLKKYLLTRHKNNHVVFNLDDQITVREAYPVGDIIHLIARNPAYQSLIYEFMPEENSFQFKGVVTRISRLFKRRSSV